MKGKQPVGNLNRKANTTIFGWGNKSGRLLIADWYTHGVVQHWSFKRRATAS